MTKTNTSQFQKGIFIDFRGEINQIVGFQFVSPGKGSAFVRTKLKNVKTGKVLEFTYKSGEQVEEIPVNTREMQYLYKSNTEYVFMDNRSYEQISVPEGIIGTFVKFLKEGDIYQILINNNQAIGIRIPKKVRLKVTVAEEAIKGNTVIGGKKIVTLETGIKIAVPLFIKAGDTLAIDPETTEYIERV